MKLATSSRLPRSATYIAPVPDDHPIRFTFHLRRRPDHHPIPAFEDFVGCPPRDRYDPNFAEKYGAHPDELDAVLAFCAEHGFRVIDSHLGRRQVQIMATTKQCNRAFKTELHHYEKHDPVHGKFQFRAHDHLHVPDHIGPTLIGVLGLSNEIRTQATLVPQSCLPYGSGARTPFEISLLYRALDVAAIDQVVGVWGWGHSEADISKTLIDWGYDFTPSIPSISVHGGIGDINRGGVEGNLDVAMAVAFANNLKHCPVYFPNLEDSAETYFPAVLSRVIHPEPGDPICSIFSISVIFTGPVEDYPDLLEACETVFQDAALLGVTMLAATGDAGSSNYSTATDNLPLVGYPASSPWCTAIGGTIVGNLSGNWNDPDSLRWDEWAWNDTGTVGATGKGASGGGVSKYFPIPSYQSTDYIPVSLNNGNVGRGIPDVSGNASAYSGYSVYLNGSPIITGGVSATTPQYAGNIAQINQMLGRNVGFLNPTLYALNNRLAPSTKPYIRDIDGHPGSTQDNHFDPFPGYPVVPGWDAVTGWGVVNFKELASYLIATTPPTPTPPPPTPPGPTPTPPPTSTGQKYQLSIKRQADLAWIYADAFVDESNTVDVQVGDLPEHTIFHVRIQAEDSRPSPQIIVATSGVGTVSPDGTLVSDTTGHITDNDGNVWTLVAEGTLVPYVVAMNNVADLSATDVISLVWNDNRIYFQNKSYSWFSKAHSNEVWEPSGDPRSGAPTVLSLPANTQVIAKPATVMTYHGGPVLDNAQVTLIYWGSDWLTGTLRNELSASVSAMITGNYLRALSEYNIADPPVLINEIVTTSTATPAPTPVPVPVPVPTPTPPPTPVPTPTPPPTPVPVPVPLPTPTPAPSNIVQVGSGANSITVAFTVDPRYTYDSFTQFVSTPNGSSSSPAQPTLVATGSYQLVITGLQTATRYFVAIAAHSIEGGSSQFGNGDIDGYGTIGAPPAPSPTPTPVPVPTPTPSPSGESASGSMLTSTAGRIIDASTNIWTLVPGTSGLSVAVNNQIVGTYGSADVVLLLYWNHTIYQENSSGLWWVWQNDWVDSSDPRVAPPPTPVPVPTPSGIFTVSQANGVRDGAGNRWELRGYNCDHREYNNVKANLFRYFPGANFVRVVIWDPGSTTPATIKPMIDELTGRNIVCLIDYHADFNGNIGWYQQMCAAYKNNPLAWIETPNEPYNNVSADQISIIKALRTAGWVNPIGLEITGGYMLDNVGPTMNAVAQNNQIFLCPHNYGDWWNGNLQNQCNATGLYSVVDEFGDATDGVTIDANGTACVQHIIQSQQAHQNGAAFWAATNGYHEGDNLFLDPNGNTLSSMGRLIQQMGWLA